MISSSAGKTNRIAENGKLTVRANPGRYLGAAFVALFFFGLTARFGFGTSALAVLVIAWTTLAIFAFSDKVNIERRRMVKTGIAQRIASMFTGNALRLKFVNIEQIETNAVQRFRRGGRVFYSYRTVVRGGDAEFTFRSSQSKYGDAIATIFATVPDDVMDNRSLELQDYFAERRGVRSRARAAEIPRGDVLEGSWRRSRLPRPSSRPASTQNAGDLGRAESLRRLANELRIAGHLVQSLEVFRRAALLQPKNGWLLFEFGRCILSFAASERDESLERRGFAMLRLAEQRAGSDVELLSRLGESYFHAGNWRRASIAFRKVTETFGVTFRSVRGQAEIALREGKFAHVVHNFSIANTISTAASLKRWTSAEIDYFTRLNGDDEYMELEISRLSLADTFYRLGNSCIPVTAAGIAVILAGMLISDEAITDIGWVIAGIAMALWTAARIGTGVLAARIPVDGSDD